MKSENKRNKLKSEFKNIDFDIFRTDRDKRVEKARRKKALSRFERREAKHHILDDND